MKKNNLNVETDNDFKTGERVSIKKTSMEVPTPKKDKVNSSIPATKDSFILESLSVAWNLLRWRPWYVAGVPILILILISMIVILPIFLIDMLAVVLLVFASKNIVGAMIIGVAILFLFGLVIYLFLKFILPASMFQYIFIRDLLLGRNVNIKETFKSLMDWGLIGRFFGGTFLLTLIIIGGLLLFIIPGMFWMIKYMFVPMLILDKNMKIGEAFKASANMTSGYRWSLFLYYLLIGVLGSIISLVLGKLFMIPIVIPVYVFIYFVFSGQVKAVKLKTSKASIWQMITLLIVSILLQLPTLVNILTFLSTVK